MQELEAQLQSLQSSLQEATNARGGMARELEEVQETLYGQIAELKQQSYELGERLERAQADAAQAGALRAEHEGLQARLAERDAEIASCRARISDLAAAREQLAAKEVELEGAWQRLNELEAGDKKVSEKELLALQARMQEACLSFLSG
jgi:chromosome segregation ATPase